MKSLRFALLSLCPLAGVASAQFISPVMTTTNMGTWSTYNILNLTNGVGLPAVSLDALHSATWQDMWISNQITTGWLQFDFGSVQPLNAIAVWNYNSSISLQRGVASMNVSLSTDGINFTPFSTEALAPGTNAPLAAHLIQIGGLAAQHVRFDILANHGNNYTGLSEVQFVAGSGGVLGSNTVLGQGCIRSLASFYELFATAAAFDLANSSLTMIPSVTGYIVLSGTSSYLPPSAGATALALTDNSQLAVTLSAPFAYPGGSTTSLMVCSNGFVSVATGNGTGTTPSATTMLAASQTGWWAWHNYNPAAVGSGQVKFEQVGAIAFVTWDGVYDSGGTSPANANTLQFQFDTGSGAVHLVFQGMSGLGNGHLVGYSPGGASVNPGNTDLSAALPGTIVLGGSDILPLTLAGGTRPVIGNPWTLNVTNVPATGTLGVEIFGVADPNIPDLGFLGAPGCPSRASLDVLNVWLVAGASHSYTWVLPNVPAIVGVHVYTQAAVLQPGVNQLLGGVITANGIDGAVGNL
ncbi:MAG: discoidin domain-containing protein [Planctomycetota bacterium]